MPASIARPGSVRPRRRTPSLRPLAIRPPHALQPSPAGLASRAPQSDTGGTPEQGAGQGCKAPSCDLGRRLTRACSVCAPLLLGITLLGCQGDTPRPETARAAVESAREVSHGRHDQPDAAEAYYQAKRQPLDPSFDVLRAYEKAEEQRRRMPHHSLALDSAPRPLLTARSLRGRTSPQLPPWEFLGPGNIGGRLRGFVIDPTDPDTMYASGVSGGVWKTTDGGATWATATDQLANIAFNSLVMDPTDPTVLYGGTGEGYFREDVRGTGLPLRGAGIWVTRDAGATWSRLTSTESKDFYWVNDLAVSYLDHNRIYAATRTGVWRSDDAGASWTNVLPSTAKGGCLDLALRSDTSSDFLFASCGTLEQAAVYRSRGAEGTGAWELVLSEGGMGRTSLAIAPSNQRVIYALAASNVPSTANPSDQGLLAVFRSEAEGAAGSWSAQVRNTSPDYLARLLLTNPIAANYVRCGWDTRNVYINMGWYCNVIAVDPVNPNIVWAAGVDLFRSDDGGRTWGVASYWWASRYASYVHADQHNIVFHPWYDGVTNQTMFAACDGGVYRTDSARAALARDVDYLCQAQLSQVRFTGLNHALGVTQFYQGAAFPGATRYLGGTQDNGTVVGSDEAGTEGWQMVYGGDGGYVAVDPNDPTIVYVQSQNFDLRKSFNGGRTFTASRTGISGSEAFLFITPLAMDPNDSWKLWTGGLRLWRTSNGAANWYPASTVLDGLSQVSAIAVAPGRSDRVVVGTSTGKIFFSDAALSSYASSVWSWTKPRAGWVTWIAFDPADANIVYATYGGFGGPHLYRSLDGGQSFASVSPLGSSPLPDVPVHCVLVDPDNSARLFMGTDVGVFVSADYGRSWAVENTGFASAVTESLTLGTGDDGSRYLFAFTHGRGAWRVKLPDSGRGRLSARPRLGRP
jgi:photosystem II stability/assembly factor-like uncharacterized protein